VRRHARDSADWESKRSGEYIEGMYLENVDL